MRGESQAVLRQRSLRALELGSEASRQEIRQAYLDLVRVWHSDRFQSDPRLRRIAEARTLEINEAYAFLQADTDKKDQCDAPGPSFGSRKGVDFRPLRDLAPFRFVRSTGLVVAIVFLVSVPAVPVYWIVTRGVLVLRDRLDLNQIIRSPNYTPSILTPTAAIEPLDNLSTALRHLTDWANEDRTSLWRPAPAVAKPLTAAQQETDKGPPTSVANRKVRSPQDVRAYVVPHNGLELIQRTSGAGSGEINFSNESDRDAVAILFSGRSQQPSMAIYVTRRQTASLSTIPRGVFSVQVEFGNEWDARSFQFGKDRSVVARAEPLQFYEVTTTSGVRGRSFSIALKLAQSANAIPPLNGR